MRIEGVDHYVKLFLGHCHGVVLSRRGEDDPHVVVQLIIEDDGNWFISLSNFSAFWLPELQDLLSEAEVWMMMHCEKISDGGYEFK